MNKSERLNDMMLFLKDKSSFNLKDLMDKYHISKSTALRDVSSLEKIGMPIYSQHGRNGYYGILQNRLLAPIYFNLNEVIALYFSMLTLQAYESTPFHLSVDNLKTKFENCLSKQKIEMLKNMENVFSLASTQHHNESPFLSKILQYAVDEKVCTVTYRKEEKEQKFPIQFFNISSSYGQWYVTGYNFETESIRVFRCDKILNVEKNNNHQPKPLSEFLKPADVLYKRKESTDFEVEISKKGLDLFYKEHYPSMKLDHENDKYFIRGFYNIGEEAFISNYLASYGERILSIQPKSLKMLIIDRLNSQVKYFSEI